MLKTSKNDQSTLWRGNWREHTAENIELPIVEVAPRWLTKAHGWCFQQVMPTQNTVQLGGYAELRDRRLQGVHGPQF